jgi:hypothetical protein
MTIPYCHLCESRPADKAKYGNTGLADGDYCPACYRPVCKFHQGRVRWRWRDSRAIETGFVCMECKNSYQHRTIDPAKRDWIS